ncbi:MAG: hypothetical protein ACRELB_13700 [Polyangiaceae bacterium]
MLRDLLDWVAVPKVFVEFGFHPREFNCAGLIGSFSGLLVDGDDDIVALAKRVLPPNVTAVRQFLDLEHLDVIRDFCRDRELGVLSVDVDGNDYWFLERLITLRPWLIITEYNASMGHRALSVPYDRTFERHAKHPSGWYHGASLAALTHLCEGAGYGLVAVAAGGGTAFFLRRDVAGDVPALSPRAAYRENALRNRWSKTTATEQWERIRHLPFVDVTALPR